MKDKTIFANILPCTKKDEHKAVGKGGILKEKNLHDKIYRILEKKYGNLGWWPAETSDEVLIGAVLTQNTSWKNVEKSINELSSRNLLSLRSIAESSLEVLAESVRSSGYYNTKARYLKNIANEVAEKYGNLKVLSRISEREAMEFLASIRGIGSETMESIMLYALNFPIAVIDSYTYRILGRLIHFFKMERIDLRNQIEKSFDHDVSRLKNYHAMIVQFAKDYCKKNPLCAECPLSGSCDYFISLSSP